MEVKVLYGVGSKCSACMGGHRGVLVLALSSEHCSVQTLTCVHSRRKSFVQTGQRQCVCVCRRVCASSPLTVRECVVL